ncbi:MAG: sodium:calcium antiporter [Syntrophomonadaceae bacterium]|jgi:cation:H+ antiporter|nr:sodium:calcium antiporter [Syntrophomonadaceae bacterium]
MSNFVILIASLGVILAGAELFVNGIEWLGKKMNLSESAVGSVLAAVGTALPETLIPIIAIVFTSGTQGHDIGIGAILGAPLMLSTLAMFVTGVGVLMFKRQRGSGEKVLADYHTMKKDLLFFIAVYLVAVLTGLIPQEYRLVKLGVAVLLIASYVFYVKILFSQEREHVENEQMPRFYFAGKASEPRLGMIILQIMTSLAFIIIGAKLFVDAVSNLAVLYGIPAFILAIIITPVATELPEKFNSVIWISRGKDTLALGNITGAMVFQSSLIPAIGILLTDWELTGSALMSAALALISSAAIYLELTRKKHITVRTLLLGGFIYVLFLGLVIQGVIR